MAQFLFSAVETKLKYYIFLHRVLIYASYLIDPERIEISKSIGMIPFAIEGPLLMINEQFFAFILSIVVHH